MVSGTPNAQMCETLTSFACIIALNALRTALFDVWIRDGMQCFAVFQKDMPFSSYPATSGRSWIVRKDAARQSPISNAAGLDEAGDNERSF